MNEGDFLQSFLHLLTTTLFPVACTILVFWRLGHVEKRQITNVPLIVKMQEEFHKEFASRKEFLEHKEHVSRRHDEHAREIASLYRKLESDKEEIIHAGEDRATKIHDRINVVIEKVGELRGEMKGRHA